MFLDKNKEIEILKNIFKDNTYIDSIFIDSWNSIYISNNNEDEYIKSDYSFYDSNQYTTFIKYIIDNEKDKDEKSNYYLKIEPNIDFYIHIWDSNDYWAILKRIPTN